MNGFAPIRVIRRFLFRIPSHHDKWPTADLMALVPNPLLVAMFSFRPNHHQNRNCHFILDLAAARERVERFLELIPAQSSLPLSQDSPTGGGS